MSDNLCPAEIEHTRNMALSGQDSAVQLRINSSLETCAGLPVCEGPATIEVQRTALAGLLLGKCTTRLICPKVHSTIQT